MRYKVVEVSVSDLETELNKDDYKDYEVISVIYDGSKAQVIMIKRYY